jgi:hypothetical protein
MAPGHVGLGPSLVDKDQAFGLKSALVLLPPLAPAGDIGAVPGLRRGRLCSLARRLFFERDIFACEKRPQRAVAHLNPIGGQLGVEGGPNSGHSAAANAAFEHRQLQRTKGSKRLSRMGF